MGLPSRSIGAGLILLAAQEIPKVEAQVSSMEHDDFLLDSDQLLW